MLHACSIGLGACVAGCSLITEQPDGDTPADTDANPTAAKTETETGTPTSDCSSNYLVVMPTSEKHLEEGTYEKQRYENLSAKHQDQFKSALADERPPISDENLTDWYVSNTYNGEEHRVQLIIEYEMDPYATEIRHADHC